MALFQNPDIADCLAAAVDAVGGFPSSVIFRLLTKETARAAESSIFSTVTFREFQVCRYAHDGCDNDHVEDRIIRFVELCEENPRIASRVHTLQLFPEGWNSNWLKSDGFQAFATFLASRLNHPLSLCIAKSKGPETPINGMVLEQALIPLAPYVANLELAEIEFLYPSFLSIFTLLTTLAIRRVAFLPTLRELKSELLRRGHSPSEFLKHYPYPKHLMNFKPSKVCKPRLESFTYFGSPNGSKFDMPESGMDPLHGLVDAHHASSIACHTTWERDILFVETVGGSTFRNVRCLTIDVSGLYMVPYCHCEPNPAPSHTI